MRYRVITLMLGISLAAASAAGCSADKTPERAETKTQTELQSLEVMDMEVVPENQTETAAESGISDETETNAQVSSKTENGTLPDDQEEILDEENAGLQSDKENDGAAGAVSDAGAEDVLIVEEEDGNDETESREVPGAVQTEEESETESAEEITEKETGKLVRAGAQTKAETERKTETERKAETEDRAGKEISGRENPAEAASIEVIDENGAVLEFENETEPETEEETSEESETESEKSAFKPEKSETESEESEPEESESESEGLGNRAGMSQPEEAELGTEQDTEEETSEESETESEKSAFKSEESDPEELENRAGMSQPEEAELGTESETEEETSEESETESEKSAIKSEESESESEESETESEESESDPEELENRAGMSQPEEAELGTESETEEEASEESETESEKSAIKFEESESESEKSESEEPESEPEESESEPEEPESEEESESETEELNFFLASPTSRVNVRAGASTDTESKAVIEPGSRIIVLENREDGWSAVRFESENGIDAGYVKTEYLIPASQIRIAAENVNVRSEPNSDSDDNKLGKFEGGEEVPVLEGGAGEWSKILFTKDGTTEEAYVKTEFLSEYNYLDSDTTIVAEYKKMLSGEGIDAEEIMADFEEETEMQKEDNGLPKWPSDPVKAQFSLLRWLVPDIETVGVIYTRGNKETRELVQVYKDTAEDYGMTIVEETVTSLEDIDLAASELVGDVYGILIMDDEIVNSVVNVVTAYADEVGIPVIGFNEEQVKNGAAAAIDNGTFYYSRGELEKLGISLDLEPDAVE